MDLAVVGASFLLIFLLEFGDKTQLAVLSLTARTGRTAAVFSGAALALAGLALVAVVIGATAAELAPREWVERVAGAGFIAIGAVILWQSHSGAEGEGGRQIEIQDRRRLSGPLGWLRVFALSFGVGLVAEMGDKSQLAIIAIAAQTAAPVSVFIGSVGGLALATLVGALAGSLISRVAPAHVVTRGAGVLFVITGALVLFGLFPEVGPG